MLYIFLLILAAAVTQAAPGSSPRCKKDICHNAVFHGPPTCPTAYADAKRDCSAFLRTTVIPCQRPAAHTVTHTYHARPVTVTKCRTKILPGGGTVTDDYTEKNTVEQATTVDQTATLTIEATTTETTTKTQIVNVIAGATLHVTVTTTTTILGGPTDSPIARSPDVTDAPELLSREFIGLEARHYSSCKPITKVASKPASYAYKCKSHKAYSSACSCLGVKGHTITLATGVKAVTTIKKTVTPTVTKWNDKTVTATAGVKTITHTTHLAVTVTDTVTNTVRAYTTDTRVITDTSLTTRSTTSYTTIETTTDATTTVTKVASATGCAVVQKSGDSVGKYLSVDPSFRDALVWGPKSKAREFYLNAQKQLSSNGLLVIALPNDPSGVFLQGFYQLGQRGSTALDCLVAPGNQVITCTPTGDGVNDRWMSAGGGTTQLSYGTEAIEQQYNLTDVIMAMECPHIV